MSNSCYYAFMNILEYENLHEQRDHALPDFPYNTYLCSIPLDFTTVPPHWHKEMELIYIKKGEGIINVDFRTHHVQAPTLVFTSETDKCQAVAIELYDI